MSTMINNMPTLLKFVFGKEYAKFQKEVDFSKRKIHNIFNKETHLHKTARIKTPEIKTNSEPKSVIY
jgi:hypothetical protein